MVIAMVTVIVMEMVIVMVTVITMVEMTRMGVIAGTTNATEPRTNAPGMTILNATAPRARIIPLRASVTGEATTNTTRRPQSPLVQPNMTSNIHLTHQDIKGETVIVLPHFALNFYKVFINLLSHHLGYQYACWLEGALGVCRNRKYMIMCLHYYTVWKISSTLEMKKKYLGRTIQFLFFPG